MYFYCKHPIVPVVFVVLSLSACATSSIRSSASRASDQLATIINRSQDAALAAYEIQKEAAVRNIAIDGGSREVADAAVFAIRVRWEPVWAAYAAVGAVHAVLVSILEQAQSEDNGILAQIPATLASVEAAWRKVKVALCAVNSEAACP